MPAPNFSRSFLGSRAVRLGRRAAVTQSVRLKIAVYKCSGDDGRRRSQRYGPGHMKRAAPMAIHHQRCNPYFFSVTRLDRNVLCDLHTGSATSVFFLSAKCAAEISKFVGAFTYRTEHAMVFISC